MATPPSSAELLTLLGERGLAATTQRLALLSALLSVDEGHVSAEDLYRELSDRFPTLSRATVYNNLAALGAAGLIEKLDTGDGSRYGPVAGPHVNLVCMECGRITDVLVGDAGLDSLVQRAAEAGQFSARSVSMSVSGICAACAEKSPGDGEIRSSRPPASRTVTPGQGGPHD
jgi:Fe2+ or Zn2+ uptake regulation protein